MAKTSRVNKSNKQASAGYSSKKLPGERAGAPNLPTQDSCVNDGQPLAMERSDSEEMLRKTLASVESALHQYMDLYDQAFVAYFGLNCDGVITHFNSFGAQFLEVDSPSILQRPFESFVSSETVSVFRSLLADVLRNGGRQTCELVLLTQTGATKCARVNVSQCDIVRECCVTLIDTTEYKRIEENYELHLKFLDHQNDIFVALLKTIPLGIFMVEVPSGKPLIANEEAIHILGRGILTDATESNLAEVYSAYKLSTHLPYPADEMPVLLGMKGRKVHIDDMLVVRPDGTESLLEVFGSPVTDAHGQVWASLVSFMDITERKRAEEALRESEENFRILFDTMAQGVIYQNADGMIVMANRAAESILGLSLDEMRGRCSADPRWKAIREDGSAYLSDDHPAMVALRTGRPANGVMGVFHPSEEAYRWIVINAVPQFHYQESLPYRVYATITDITERKKSEESLRDSQVTFRQTFDLSPVGVAMVGLDQRFLRCNKAFTLFIGYSEKEMIGKTINDITFPEDSSIGMAELKAILDGSIDTAQVQKRYVRKDGQIVWGELSISLVRNDHGKPEYFVPIIQDVTDRVNAIEALQDRERLLKEMGMIAKIGGWEFDALTLQGTWTDEVARIHEVDPLQKTDVQFGTSFYIDGHRQQIEKAIEEAFTLGKPYDLDLEMITAKGNHKWVRTIGQPVEENGRVIKVRGSFQDITERKVAEKALARAAQRDRHIADTLQKAVMPSHLPLQPQGYDIATKYQPALSEAEVGGDLYDMFDMGDGKIGIAIGDIVGKGLLGAARVSAVRHTIRSYAFIDASPSRVILLANDALCRDTLTENDMLTAFFAVLDTQNSTLSYTNAGHEPPLVIHRGGEYESLAIGGPMFHGLCKTEYLESSLDIQIGDVFVMVTDGITEARADSQLSFFGAEGIVRCLARNAHASAQQIVTALVEDASAFANGNLRDDVAIVVIRKIGQSADTGTSESQKIVGLSPEKDVLQQEKTQP